MNSNHWLRALLAIFTIAFVALGVNLLAQDPYSGVERGSVTEPRQPAPPVPPCPTACFMLQWRPLADVIDVTGFGGIGVEGPAAGILRDPNDGRVKIYVSHGYSASDTTALRIFDIAANTWSVGPNASAVRSELSGAAFGGRFFAIGGRPTQGTVEIFDPGPGTWSFGTAMPTARDGFGTAAARGRIHAIGGRTCGSPNCGPGLTTHEAYDPGTDSWMPRAPLPFAVGDNYATTRLGGRIFTFGGFDGAGVVHHTQVYNPATDGWMLRLPMPTARSNAIAGTLAGRAVVIGGLDNLGNNMARVEVYDPALNNWCMGPMKPTPSSEMASSGINLRRAIFALGVGAFGTAGNTAEVLILREVDCQCPRSQGFWKNHPADWPVDSLMLGMEGYTQDELLDILMTPPKGDASIILAYQLIAAKLNFAAGSRRPPAVTTAILNADMILGQFPGKLPYDVKTSTPVGRRMTRLAQLLDRFNNSFLTPECLE